VFTRRIPSTDEESDTDDGAAIVSAVSATVGGGTASPAVTATDAPSAGAVAPALDAAALGTLMDELAALGTSDGGRWRFALEDNAAGLDTLVLSRGASGGWHLRLGAERARPSDSPLDLVSLRGALRERGHRVDDIVVAMDEGHGAWHAPSEGES